MHVQGFRAYANSAVDAAAKKRRVVGLVTLVLWILATVSAFLAFQARTTPLQLLILVLLMALFIVVHLQATLVAWSASRDWSRLLALIYSTRYLSEVKGMPARQAFLAELDGEMRISRAGGPACTLVVTRFAALEAECDTLGDHFAHRAVEQLGARLKRVTRGGDLLGYVGEGTFATLLVDCNKEESQQFLRRIPPSLSIESHEKRPVSFTVEVQCGEYDRRIEDPVDFLDQVNAHQAPMARVGVQGTAVARSA